MGGNVQIGTKFADRIDLLQVHRYELVEKLTHLFDQINIFFHRKHKKLIWGYNLFNSYDFLSGSSRHLFDMSIPTSEFIRYKPSLGDIDLQVDIIKKEEIRIFLDEMKENKFAHFDFIGYKVSSDQFITLWKFKKKNINIQIDFEFVEFSAGAPTNWSLFSHSSAWEDITEGIKGVFHKYLLRALTTKTLRDVIVLKGKKEVPTKIKATDLAFSVSHGLRKKLEPVFENGKQKVIDGLFVYKEIPTDKSTYIKDISSIFTILFDFEPNNIELKKFHSFVGTLDLINIHFSNEQKHTLILGFLNTLFGSGAQQLYRNDSFQDLNEKNVALRKMLTVLGTNFDLDIIHTIQTEYYKQYEEYA